jgi:hypothetical protein
LDVFLIFISLNYQFIEVITNSDCSYSKITEGGFSDPPLGVAQAFLPVIDLM